VHIDVWRQHLLSHAKQSGFTSFEDWYSTDPNVVLENEAGMAYVIARENIEEQIITSIQ